MIWFLLLALAALCLAPLALSLLRPARALGRAEADARLYRARLRELDAQRAAGRITEAEHAAARLEAGRRALAAGGTGPEGDAEGTADASAAPNRGTAAVTASLALLPALAVGIYLWHGAPGLPSATLAARTEAAARDEALIARLRQRIEGLDPASPAARQGWLLLGNAERARNRLPEALAAWQRALAGGFDPELAADAAELAMEADRPDTARDLLDRALAARSDAPRLRYLAGLLALRDGRPEDARRSWAALLAEGPADAPWRPGLERQLRELP